MPATRMRRQPMSQLSTPSDDMMPAHLTQQDLATRWSVSVRTLERWRADGYGPPWLALRGSVRYCLSDVLAFEAAHRRNG